MDSFEEYLDDWGFDDKWRPVVQRLHERTRTWPTQLLSPDDFAICEALEEGSAVGLLIWADLIDTRPPSHVGMTLAARVDDQGLRCGRVEPSRPDDLSSADLTWFIRPIRLDALEQTADDLLDWFAVEARRWERRLSP